MGLTLAEELRRIRGIKGVSLRDVEKGIKISNAYLSQLERGDIKEPSPHILYKLAQFYKVEYETLMELAGYLKHDQAKPKRPSAMQAALMSANLSDTEMGEVAKFIEYLHTKKKMGK